MTEELCQTCGKLIEFGEDFVEVRYGKIQRSMVNQISRIDCFHKKCDKAFFNGGKNNEKI